MFEVREFSSAEELMANYAEVRRRVQSAKTPPPPAAKYRAFNGDAFGAIGATPPKPVIRPLPGRLWKAPRLTAMLVCNDPPGGAWRRFIDGAVIVLIDGVEKYCPPLSNKTTSVYTTAVEAGEVLPPLLPDGTAPRTNKGLMKAVAFKHGMSALEMLSDRRNVRVVRARQECMWWFKTITTFSLPHIGQIMGGRDHTTILHGVRRHQARIDRGEV